MPQAGHPTWAGLLHPHPHRWAWHHRKGVSSTCVHTSGGEKFPPSLPRSLHGWTVAQEILSCNLSWVSLKEQGLDPAQQAPSHLLVIGPALAGRQSEGLFPPSVCTELGPRQPASLTPGRQPNGRIPRGHVNVLFLSTESSCLLLGLYLVHSKGPSSLREGAPSSGKSSLIPSSSVSLCFPKLCPDPSGSHGPGISISATQWALQAGLALVPGASPKLTRA